MNRLFVVMLLAAFCLAGCGKSPLQKLASDKIYLDMNPEFWSAEYDDNTKLWKQGLEYCKKHADKPNCGAVINIYAINEGAKFKASPIGHSGNAIAIPTGR